MTEARTPQAVENWLLARVHEEIGHRSVDPERPLADYGLDSAMVLTLTGELEEWLGLELDPTAFFDYPSARALSAWLAAGFRSPDVGGVSIVGMACRVPGADDVDAFWKLLLDGRCVSGEVRPDGLRNTGLERAALLTDVGAFDAELFDISPAEASAMDPQQRLLLETTWRCLEDAGLTPEELRGSRTGVWIGISGSEYALESARRVRQPLPTHLTGAIGSIAANRISYQFDLRGPSVAIDTACSSSLVALDAACKALRSGVCDRALVGGVSLVLDDFATRCLQRAGVLAPDGRCKTFSSAADGYGRGEGCGVLLLQAQEPARAAKHRSYAVIAGTAVNQDGASNGLMAPNRTAQERVLRDAWQDAALAPTAADYVEAHGTGTLLGDPIETKALGAVLGKGREGDPCEVGSVKTNIGHLEAAAGIAGVIKTALMLHRQQRVPTLHAEQPNPYIRFEKLGLRICTGAGEWGTPDGLCTAGVSSFGIGGTNAHAVLARTPEPDGEPRPALLPRPFARQTHWLSDEEPQGASAMSVLASITGRSPEAIRDAGSLEDLGLSSVDRIELAEALVQARPELSARMEMLQEALTLEELETLAGAQDTPRQQPTTDAEHDVEVVIAPAAGAHRRPQHRVLEDLTESDGKLGASLRVDPEHPFHFDHPYDHVPGVLFVEAVQQALESVHALLHPTDDRSWFVRTARLRFDRWSDLDERLRLHIEELRRNAGGWRTKGRILLEDGTSCMSFTCEVGFADPLAVPEQAVDGSLPGEWVHKTRSENILLGRSLRVPRTFQALPPPVGHALLDGPAPHMSLTHIVELGRQLGTSLEHESGSASDADHFIFMGCDLQMDAPVASDAPVELIAPTAARSVPSGMQLGRRVIELSAGGRVLGSVTMLAALANADEYASQRGLDMATGEE